MISKYQSVADFYAGKSIFITSGTGFIGKVFLEKILYSCRDVDKIYVLVREKGGKTVEERINNLLCSEVFTRIRIERPSDLSKVVPVAGDICLDNLGINQQDEGFLNKVSVVFHVAASIKFNDRLDFSLNSNVEGTRRVLNLCRRMNSLQAYVHVSTAYTFTDRDILEEEVYPPAASLSDVYKFIEEHGVENDGLLQKFLNGRPNTYTFTKALAETLVAEHDLSVPAIIIRPSIVSPAMTEPLEGWVDTWMGASGLLVSTAKGFNRVLFGEKQNNLDLIPVDFVVNFMIVAAAKCDDSKKVTVYNCCTSSRNPVCFRELHKYLFDFSSENRFNDLPFPSLLFTTNEKVEFIATLVLQRTPSYVADLWRIIIGKKPRYARIQSQLLNNRDMLRFFTSHSWEMKCDRMPTLYSSLIPQDQQTFPCDPASINWRQYIPVYMRGAKRYLVKM